MRPLISLARFLDDYSAATLWPLHLRGSLEWKPKVLGCGIRDAASVLVPWLRRRVYLLLGVVLDTEVWECGTCVPHARSAHVEIGSHDAEADQASLAGQVRLDSRRFQIKECNPCPAQVRCVDEDISKQTAGEG